MATNRYPTIRFGTSSWAYEGWQYVTFAAGEAIDPQRTFPRAITVGTVLLIFIYVVANLGYVAALGVEGVRQSDRAAAAAVQAAYSPTAAKAIAAVILISMFSAANGFVLTGARLYFSMARDGVFFRRLGEVHPRFGTPAFAVVTASVWAILLALTGSFEQLLTYVLFAGWIFYGIGALSIFVFRRTSHGAPRTFRVPGYPVTPVIFVLAAAAIVANALVTAPMQAFAGLAFVLLGIPVYLFWSRRSASGRA